MHPVRARRPNLAYLTSVVERWCKLFKNGYNDQKTINTFPGYSVAFSFYTKGATGHHIEFVPLNNGVCSAEYLEPAYIELEDDDVVRYRLVLPTEFLPVRPNTTSPPSSGSCTQVSQHWQAATGMERRRATRSQSLRVFRKTFGTMSMERSSSSICM